MKAALIFLFALVAFAAAQDANEPADSDVVVLDVSNFEETAGEGTWMIKFYAPWCGHCKNMIPTWEAVATTLKGKVNVGKVDVTANQDLGKRFSIKGFPTLIKMKDGKFDTYSGARTEEALVAFAEKDMSEGASAVPPMPAAAQAELEEAVPEGPSDVIELNDKTFEHDTQASSGSTTGVWVVEFFAPWCGHCKNLAPAYEKLATALKGEVNVAKVDGTQSQVSMKRFGVKGFPTIILLDEGKYYTFEGERSLAGMKEWAQGGYKSTTPVAVPEEPTFMDIAIDALFQSGTDCMTVIKHLPHTAVMFAMGGFLLGFLLAIFMFGCRVKVVEVPAKAKED